MISQVFHQCEEWDFSHNEESESSSETIGSESLDSGQYEYTPIVIKTTETKTDDLVTALNQLLKRHQEDTDKLIKNSVFKIKSLIQKIKEAQSVIKEKEIVIKKLDEKNDHKKHMRKLNDLKNSHRDEIKKHKIEIKEVIEVEKAKSKAVVEAEKAKARAVNEKKRLAEAKLKSEIKELRRKQGVELKKMKALSQKQVQEVKKQMALLKKEVEKKQAELNAPKLPSRSGNIRTPTRIRRRGDDMVLINRVPSN